MRKGLFTYDFENYFKGYLRDDLATSWNGWECPAFEKKEVEKIAKTLDSDFFKVEYSQENDCFILYDLLYKEENEKEVFKGYDITINGEVKRVYDFGNCSICWSEKD